MKCSLKSNYAEVIFDSLANRNAFGLADAETLLKFSKQAVKNGAGVLVFKNIGPYFCAGGDLASILKLKTKKAGTDLNSKIEKKLDEFARLPLYKVAMVGGDCFGGGTELLSCFDLRLSVSFACFGFFQKRFDLTTGWGGLQRWQKQGVFAANNLLASGRIFSSYEAQRLGFVHGIYSAVEESEYLERVLSDLGGSSERLGLVSGLVHKPADEKKVFNQLWWSKEHQSALSKSKKIKY